MKRRGAQLKLVLSPDQEPPGRIENPGDPLSTIDLFCGAGGITEGFREAGYRCLYANDCMPEAIETFSFNHPGAWAEDDSIEDVDAAQVRRRLGLRKGGLDVLVGGPPCQGFSINAPERFLSDPRTGTGWVPCGGPPPYSTLAALQAAHPTCDIALAQVSSAPPGQQLYSCSGSGVWTQLIGGGGGAAPAPVFGAYASRPACASSNTGQLFHASDIGNKHWECDGTTWQPVAFDMQVVEPTALTWSTMVGGGSNTPTIKRGGRGAIVSV